MVSTTTPAASALLPFQPLSMTPAQSAAVSYLARYSGHTHTLYAFQLRRWFGWCESHGLDPLVGIQRAHVELYIRDLGESGLMASTVTTMMHAVRGYFRFAHIDGLIPADPAVYARLPKVHTDESRTQGLDRLELIRFLQVSQTLTVHHAALAYLLGINALRASEAAAVRIEDYAETLRGHRVLHLVGKGNKPATMPLTVPADPRTTEHYDRARGNLDRPLLPGSKIADAVGITQPAVSQQLKSLVGSQTWIPKPCSKRARADSDIDLVVDPPEGTSSFGFIQFKQSIERFSVARSTWSPTAASNQGSMTIFDEERCCSDGSEGRQGTGSHPRLARTGRRDPRPPIDLARIVDRLAVVERADFRRCGRPLLPNSGCRWVRHLRGWGREFR